jgi:hypothetical protein
MASKWVCRVIGHKWQQQVGREGERFLKCKRCGQETDNPGPPPSPIGM